MNARVVNEIHQGGNIQDGLDRARNEAGALDGLIPWSEVTPNDVLDGRGQLIRNHPGNRFFRERCAFYFGDYFQRPRRDQVVIRFLIVNAVLSTGGRFLAPCPSDGNYWTNFNGNGRQLHRMIGLRMRDLSVAMANRDRNRLLLLGASIADLNRAGWSPSISHSFRFRSHF